MKNTFNSSNLYNKNFPLTPINFSGNKKRLLAFVSKLALKPLTAGKPKKGLVNDSDFNQDAVQNVQREVLTLPQERRREKAVTIAQLKQFQKVKAYRTLRIEQVNQRYKGIREKRRKEEEEKKKQ